MPPKVIPTKLKIVTGTARPGRINPDEPDPEASIPTPPRHLSKEAGEEWRRMAPLLFDMGLITEYDRAAFAMYCAAWGDHVKAENALRKNGHVTITKNGNEIQSTWVSISNTAKLNALKFLTEFGLTPASRTKVSATQKKEKKPEGKERFFT